MRSSRETIILKVIAFTALIALALSAILPMMIVISASVTGEEALKLYGFSILPRDFTLQAYKLVMGGTRILTMYRNTIIVTFLGTIGSVVIQTCAAYVLSRNDYKWRTVISYMFYFTLLFSGGAIASYIWLSSYLHMRNTFAVLIVPGMFSASNVFMLRAYLSKIPSAVIESAKIDGANEFVILSRLIVPMGITGIATITIMTALGYWNEWYKCLMFITDDNKMTLQYYLNSMMSSIDAIIKNQNSGLTDLREMPSESARMAVCVLGAGPMVFIFMFFQKYFVKGLTIGSVKG